MESVIDYLIGRGPYLLLVVLTVLGVYLMTSHRNYLKALIGLYFVQSAVILFFIALGFRTDGTIPILVPGQELTLDNPLPHAMMLTAIVVGVATLGLAISILRRIQAETGSIEEQQGSDRTAP
ncbi:Na+/H+ antiporter subunit C [soil metagenome]|jgi:multicomponent Na+:H+ antiporter subunit C|nr:cation:proton antiporter subunit C [Gemmatimonadota bacterium]